MCKTRYEKSGQEEDLTAAIEAYRRAFELDNATVYFGATTLALMFTREGTIGDQAFLSSVRQALESKYEDRSFDSWDYWDLVTGVELAVYARDWDAAERLARHASSLGPEEWQVESMSLQLERVRAVMPERDQDRVSKLLHNWGNLRTAS